MRVLLDKFPNAMVAQMVHDRLKIEGIPSWIEAPDVGGMYPQLNAIEGVRLMVDQEHLEQAQSVIDDIEPLDDQFQDSEV